MDNLSVFMVGHNWTESVLFADRKKHPVNHIKRPNKCFLSPLVLPVFLCLSKWLYILEEYYYFFLEKKLEWYLRWKRIDIIFCNVSVFISWYIFFSVDLCPRFLTFPKLSMINHAQLWLLLFFKWVCLFTLFLALIGPCPRLK